MVVSSAVNGNIEAAGIPEGRYRLIGWDIDTTGRRLIDEICQIAAYTPTEQFSQYVMPYTDLSVFARRRHNVRIVTLGRYRMLKDMKSNKFLKTKSEISALVDFLHWLEENRGDASDGIILLYHEARKVAPSMLLEALKRYSLLDKFTEIVKGFANSYQLAEAKCAKTVRSFSLRMLSRVLLNKEVDLSSAATRAEMCYLLVQHLGQGERQDVEAEGSGDCSSTVKHMSELVRQYTLSITAEEKDLAGLKTILERQNTFHPVFGALIRSTRFERLHASRLRRLLAENNFDYNKLKSVWDDGKREGLKSILKDEISNANEKDIEELLEILDCHFDPDKKPVEPKPLPPRQPRVKPVKKEKPVAPTSSSEVSANAYSDAASAVSSVETPRSEKGEEIPVVAAATAAAEPNETATQ